MCVTFGVHYVPLAGTFVVILVVHCAQKVSYLMCDKSRVAPKVVVIEARGDLIFRGSGPAVILDGFLAHDGYEKMPRSPAARPGKDVRGSRNYVDNVVIISLKLAIGSR